MKQGPLAIPLDPNLANYEDRIVIDEAKRKMGLLTDKLDRYGTSYTTEYFNPEQQEKYNDYLKEAGIPKNYITGRWHSNSKENKVNIPLTPSLLNLTIAAEETSHALNKNFPALERKEKTDWRWLEEDKAKNEALEYSGGLMPQDKDVFEKTRKNYLNNLQNNIAAEQKSYNQGEEMANRNIVTDTILGLFWDGTKSKDSRKAYDYWSKENTTPIEYFSNKYPELVYGPLAKR